MTGEKPFTKEEVSMFADDLLEFLVGERASEREYFDMSGTVVFDRTVGSVLEILRSVSYLYISACVRERQKSRYEVEGATLSKEAAAYVLYAALAMVLFEVAVPFSVNTATTLKCEFMDAIAYLNSFSRKYMGTAKEFMKSSERYSYKTSLGKYIRALIADAEAYERSLDLESENV